MDRVKGRLKAVALECRVMALVNWRKNMGRWKWFTGHVDGGVAWFRINGYGVAAIRGSSFSTRNGYHKKFIKLGDWRIEALAP